MKTDRRGLAGMVLIGFLWAALPAASRREPDVDL